MSKYVIGPDVALRLAREGAVVVAEHELLAPTLMRSQLLSLLYRAVQAGEMDRRTADAHLDRATTLRWPSPIRSRC